MARSVTAPIVRVGKKKRVTDKVSFCSCECPVLSGKRIFPAVFAVFYLFTQLFSLLILGERDSLAINE